MNGENKKGKVKPYVVTYKCGHTEERKGTEQTQEKWLAKCKDELCESCKAKEWTDFVESFSKGLVPLNGTEKQIAWAKGIRVRVLMQMDEFRKELVQVIDKKKSKEIMTCLNAVVEELEQEDSARVWIQEIKNPKLKQIYVTRAIKWAYRVSRNVRHEIDRLFDDHFLSLQVEKTLLGGYGYSDM